MNIQKVLVPVDFSPVSTLAVNYGVALARKFRAKLSLLHVIESGTALLYTFPTGAEKIEAQRVEDAEKMLPALVGPEDREDLDARFIVRAGEIKEMIEAVLLEEKADAVVMGTHGRRLFGRLLIGSVTLGLLRKLGVPVLTVCHVSRPLEFNRILLATDFAPGSEKGFQFALAMATTTGSSLVVTHTIDKRPVATFETPEVTELFEEHKQALKRAKENFARFETEGVRRKVRVECVLAEGEAAETVVRIADEQRVDFVILGLRKKGMLERALLGSTAERVIRNAHVPVLSVPLDTAAAGLMAGVSAGVNYGNRAN